MAWVEGWWWREISQVRQQQKKCASTCSLACMMLEILHIFNSSSSSDSRASTHSKPLPTLLTLEKATVNFTEAFFYSTSTKIRNFPLVVVFSPQLKHGGKRRTWHKRLKKVLSTSPFKCKRVSRAKERRKKETKKREKMSRCGNLLFCHSAYFSHHHQRSQVQQEPF